MGFHDKYLGTPDCFICQNGVGDGKCGLNSFFNAASVKKFDICLRFFKQVNGKNTHYKKPGVFYKDHERCPVQWIGNDVEWQCKKQGTACDHVCDEKECMVNKTINTRSGLKS